MGELPAAPQRLALSNLAPATWPTSPVPVRMVEPCNQRMDRASRSGPAGSWAFGTCRNGPHLYGLHAVKREDLRNRLLRLVGLGQLNLMTQALDDASSRVSRYMLMQFLVNAGFGVLFGFGLYLIGVPNPAYGVWSPASCGLCRMWARWLRQRYRSRSRWPFLMDGSAAARVPLGCGPRTDHRATSSNPGSTAPTWESLLWRCW